jgi:uncharacterized 2Fe-2S/4Fe-4S cluster protein (DUF4445 family)
MSWQKRRVSRDWHTEKGGVVEDSTYVRLEVKVPLAEMDKAARDAGLIAECFETDGLTGDPATVALVALVSAEVIRAVQALVSTMVKRDKAVEVVIGKKRIKAASLSDAEKLFEMLSEYLKEDAAPKGQ